jgi:hypothetical protein
MKKLFASVMTLFYSSFLLADVQCSGVITKIQSNSSFCNGNYAYKISGNDEHWICSDADLNDTIILSALLSQKSVNVILPGTGSCFSGLNQDYIVHYSINISL